MGHLGSYKNLVVVFAINCFFIYSLNKLSENELKPSRKDFPSPISAPASASSITAIDVTGILRVWFLLLEGLTNAVVQCPKRYQPQTLEVLFDILRSVTTVPGPNFSIYAVTHLLLPMLQSWVKRGNRSKVYWENTAANFKHACGLATELVVQELNQYLSVQGRKNLNRDSGNLGTNLPRRDWVKR